MRQRTVGRRLSQLFCAIAMVMALGTPFAAGAAEAPAPLRAEPLLGRTNPQQSLQLAVSLAPTDTHAIDAAIADIGNSASPNYHKYLTPAQFTARFFDPQGRAIVKSYLQSKGLTVDDPGVGSIITASGTTAAAEAAVSVRVFDYRAADGHTFHVNDAVPTFPATVAPFVTAVVGLDTSVVPEPQVSPIPPVMPQADGSPRPRSATGCPGAQYLATRFTAPFYTPNEYAAAYDFAPQYAVGRQGQGQTVAVMEFGAYNATNVANYQSCFGISIPVSPVASPPGATIPLNGTQIEAELDIEIVAGMAPQLAGILVYEGDPNNGSVYIGSVAQQVVNERRAQVLSISYGSCEKRLQGFSNQSGENTVFQQAALQGITVVVASGDDGSQGCLNSSPLPLDTSLNAVDPATQPLVLAAGGTRVGITRPGDTYGSEVVWNDHQFFNPNATGGANNLTSGGGYSKTWTRPLWQSGVGVDTGTNKRQIPDVAADATSYVIFTHEPSFCARANFFDPTDPRNSTTDCFVPSGGTSAAAPFWAAAIALMNQARAVPLGFINPFLYGTFQQAHGMASTPFHDVTVGDNCLAGGPCGTPGGSTLIPAQTALYTATSGYDLATGIGTPDVNKLINGFVSPLTVTAVTPNSGPTTGAQLVIVTGTNFPANVNVFFGPTAALSVSRTSSTSLTVTTPAHVVGAVTVTITDASNASNTASLANGFTYVMPPNTQPAQKPVGTPQGPDNAQPPLKPTAPPQGPIQPQPNRH